MLDAWTECMPIYCYLHTTQCLTINKKFNFYIRVFPIVFFLFAFWYGIRSHISLVFNFGVYLCMSRPRLFIMCSQTWSIHGRSTPVDLIWPCLIIHSVEDIYQNGMPWGYTSYVMCYINCRCLFFNRKRSGKKIITRVHTNVKNLHVLELANRQMNISE